MSTDWVEVFRWAYIVLAFLAATGFIATLVIRWDELRHGERVVRFGLIFEHLAIMYVLDRNVEGYPASFVALLLVLSLIVVVIGFAIWITEDLLHHSPDVRAPIS